MGVIQIVFILSFSIYVLFAQPDGDIIETISNGGSKRIGFNVGDSFTENSETIAHYGISNAGNDAADGGIVLSGYFGLKFATN